MNIEIGNVIVLENDKEYIVAAKTNLYEKNYLYIVDSSLKEVMFCYIENNEIVKIDDTNELDEVINMLAVNAQNNLKKIGIIQNDM